MKDNGVLKKRVRSKRLSPAYNKPDCATYYPNRTLQDSQMTVKDIISNHKY